MEYRSVIRGYNAIGNAIRTANIFKPYISRLCVGLQREIISFLINPVKDIVVIRSQGMTYKPSACNIIVFNAILVKIRSGKFQDFVPIMGKCEINRPIEILINQ